MMNSSIKKSIVPKLFLICFLGLFTQISSFAKDTEYYYFNSNWEAVTSSDYYSYIRIIKFNNHGKIILPIVDYYKYGKFASIPTPIFASNSNSRYTANTNSYLRYQGIELLAGLAHPTNDYISGGFEDYGDYKLITIKTKDSFFGGTITTKLKVKQSGNFFSDLKVISDNDIVSPFSLLDFGKEAVSELLEESSSYDQNSVEAYLVQALKKGLYDFDGVDIALLILNLNWKNY